MMKKINLPSLNTIRSIMIFLNFFILLFYCSVILFGSNYIISNQLARQYLNSIDHIPRNPNSVFFMTMILYAILSYIIYNRNERVITNKRSNIMYSVAEVVVCFVMVYYLSFCYNGVILLVFCDCIFHLKDDEYSKWVLGSLVVIYFVSNYDIFSSFMSLSNVRMYFEVFEGGIKQALFIISSVLETTNWIVFILFMITYIVNQIQENENISKELDMINQVNKELQNYASITEKIGENNERKRLAREIHDTLGHALTGIAAGIDACIATIDSKPQETKKQLYVISKVVRQGIVDVRNSLNKLRPGALEERSFKDAIKKMIDEFSKVSDLSIILYYELDDADFDKIHEDIMFRIIQEGITNALRHGGATEIKIRLYREDKTMFLVIQDNGRGCDKIVEGFGLSQMQERVSTINGQIEFKGDDGFTLLVKMPI